MDNVTNLERLRWRCYQIIPLVFDEALSYYEVLCKGAKKTNELIDFVNEMAETVQNNTENLASLQAIVGEGSIDNRIYDAELSAKAYTDEVFETASNKIGYTIFEGAMPWGNINIAPTGTQYRVTDYNIVKVWTDHGGTNPDANSDGSILCSVSRTTANAKVVIRGITIGALSTDDVDASLVTAYINYNDTTNVFTRNQSWKPDDQAEEPQGIHVHANITKIVGII